jgi:hypothetical protein
MSASVTACATPPSAFGCHLPLQGRIIVPPLQGEVASEVRRRGGVCGVSGRCVRRARPAAEPPSPLGLFKKKRKNAAKPRRRSGSAGLRAVSQPGRSDTSLPATLARCGQPISDVCKPGSVPGPKPHGRPFLSDGGCPPPPATNPDDWAGSCPAHRNARAIPIRSCSRWGLPCRFGCPSRGALLPHRFTLACPVVANSHRRSLLCGTVPDPSCPNFSGTQTAGRYPAPRSVEPGLSSADLHLTRPPDDVIADPHGISRRFAPQQAP